MWTLLWIAVAAIAINAIKERGNQLTFDTQVRILNLDQSILTVAHMQQEIVELFGFDLSGSAVSEIDLRNIEEAILTYPPVERVDVYVDAGNKVHVDLLIREPIARLQDRAGNSRYLDRNGLVFNAIPGHPARVAFVSGFFTVRDTSTIENHSTLQDLFILFSFINADPFFKAFVEQVYVREDGEYMIIPKIGQEKILLGEIDRYQHKLLKMKQFYEKELTKGKWNQYEIIDLRYRDQVIAVNKTQA